MSYLKRGERDSPENRGHGWDKRAEEIKDRDNYTCQSCGVGDEVLGVHHIIKGKHLPMGNARAWANLVTLCSDCHPDLEGLPPRLQFRRLAQYDGHNSSYRSDIADVIEYLQTGWRRKKEMRETLDIGKDRIDVIMGNLVVMGSAIKNDNSQYRTPIAEVCRAEWEHSKQKVETVELENDRLWSLHEKDEEKIEKVDDGRDDLHAELRNAVAALESAKMELKADVPYRSDIMGAVGDAMDAIASAQETLDPEKYGEDPGPLSGLEGVLEEVR